MADELTITRILVPLDGSELAEQAIPAAVALAAGGGEIVFFQAVVKAEAERDLLGQVDRDAGEVAERERALCYQDLERIAAHWASILPGTPTYEVGVGEPAVAIVAAAERLACDLIVTASHGRGAVKRVALGSVADALARTSTVPVMIVRPRDAAIELSVPQFRRVVVPYDGSELAASALPVAIAIAKALDDGILLVHAITPATMPPVLTPMEPYYPAAVYTDMLDELEASAKASLDAAAATIAASGVPVKQAVVMGTPFDAISEVTTSDDLIVLTSHGRSGFERWLIGSFAEHLVREGPVPVVIVPAPGRAEQQPVDRSS
ncbi:MAG: universal stress protein [Thermomicrobiales bacterium]|nr:universal stress protein [Thermomicrobiales bacterium]